MKANLESLYYRIKKHIDTVDFDRLWKGFKPLKFALYNSDECFFDGEYVTKTDEFLGNTAISYNNETIAIWCVSEETDDILLASKLIHEMFHGFQQLNHECRFPDELDALYHYRYDDSNLSLKLEENRIITALLEEFDKKKLQELLSMRRFRYNRFYYEYHYEACIEQIEGTAEFVELNALKQLSYKRYLESLDRLKAHITEKSNLVPIRIVCYDIGALLLMLLNENHIEYPSDFVNTPFSESLIENAKEYGGEIALIMDPVLNDYYKEADSIIAEALAKNDIVSSNPCNILGVNVYNAVYRNNYIISRYFVMYGEEQNPQVEYGNFVIETNAYKKLSRIYRF